LIVLLETGTLGCGVPVLLVTLYLLLVCLGRAVPQEVPVAAKVDVAVVAVVLHEVKKKRESSV